MKEKYCLIFVVVVYKNFTDLESFLKHLIKKIGFSYKVIVVDNFYSKEISENILIISKKYGAYYIQSQNVGYGEGNNIGISFAKENYDFEYIIVSNSDLTIEYFPNDLSLLKKDAVIAPNIITKKGKHQNPYWVRENRLFEFLIFFGCKHELLVLQYCGYLLYKIQRQIFLLKKHNPNGEIIFGAHGSFIIFPKSVINVLNEPFDKNMFLFAEESYLAHLLKSYNVPIIFDKSINVIHNEDGSIKLSSINTNKEAKKSIIYYYEKMVLKKGAK